MMHTYITSVSQKSSHDLTSEEITWCHSTDVCPFFEMVQ
jgi:hypothetical protein